MGVGVDESNGGSNLDLLGPNTLNFTSLKLRRKIFPSILTLKC